VFGILLTCAAPASLKVEKDASMETMHVIAANTLQYLLFVNAAMPWRTFIPPNPSHRAAPPEPSIRPNIELHASGII
jgi:hypothetical protein